MMYGSGPAGSTNRIKGVASTTDTTSTALVAAPGSGYKLWVSKITICNSHATSRANVSLLSGTTVIWTTPAPPIGGALEVFPDPIDCNENEALNFKSDT